MFTLDSQLSADGITAIDAYVPDEGATGIVAATRMGIQLLLPTTHDQPVVIAPFIPATAVKYNPLSGRFLVGDESGKITEYDPQALQTKEFSHHKSGISALCYWEAYNLFASGSKKNLVCLWDLDTGDCEKMHPKSGPIQLTGIGDEWLNGVVEDGRVFRWDRYGNEIRFNTHHRSIRDSAISPDEKTMAILDDANMITLYMLIKKGLKLITTHQVTREDCNPTHVAFADDDTLLVGMDDGAFQPLAFSQGTKTFDPGSVHFCDESNSPIVGMTMTMKREQQIRPQQHLGPLALAAQKALPAVETSVLAVANERGTVSFWKP